MFTVNTRYGVCACLQLRWHRYLHMHIIVFCALFHNFLPRPPTHPRLALYQFIYFTGCAAIFFALLFLIYANKWEIRQKIHDASDSVALRCALAPIAVPAADSVSSSTAVAPARFWQNPLMRFNWNFRSRRLWAKIKIILRQAVNLAVSQSVLNWEFCHANCWPSRGLKGIKYTYCIQCKH